MSSKWPKVAILRMYNGIGIMLGSYLRKGHYTTTPGGALGATSKITKTVSSRKQCNSSGTLFRPFLNSSVGFVFNNSDSRARLLAN
jgi:hypothetical protein